MTTSYFKALRDREQALPRKLSAVAATFRADVSGSPGIIHRMELQRTLEGHGGCVNTVSFNPTGDILVSGSDDQSVMLWDWRRGVRRLRFEPGHNNNIFQARFLPGSEDKTLVSCAADGQVRVSYFREGSNRPVTRRLHRHAGRAHKLALQHASPYDVSYGSAGAGGPPCFYSSGEDGDVCFFDLRVSDSDLVGRMFAAATGWSSSAGSGSGNADHRPRRIIDLNAVHVNPARPWQLVVGGADEAVVVYDNRALTSLTSSYVSSSCPARAAGGGGGRRSAGDGGGSGGAAAAGAPTRCRRVDGLPLMELCPAHLRVRDAAAGSYRQTHVTCVMFADNGDVLATYNDDDVYLFRPPGTQGSGGGRGKPGSRGDSDSDRDGGEQDLPVSAAATTTTSGRGARCRNFKDSDDGDDDGFLRPSRRRRRGGGGASAAAATAAGVLAPSSDPSLAAAVDPGDHVIGRYSGHRNHRTVKGVNFLGERQEWVVSGSDCGYIYIWGRESCRLQCWLRGDADVVNCLEPHPALPLHLATSGIDDTVKLWAPTAEKPRPPGRAAEDVMAANGRSRAAAHARSGRRRTQLVLPRAMMQVLLGDLARGGDGGGGGGGGVEASHRLREMLMAALRGDRPWAAMDNDDDDGDGEEDDADEGGGNADDDDDDESEGGEEEEEDGEEEDDEDDGYGRHEGLEEGEGGEGGQEAEQQRRGVGRRGTGAAGRLGGGAQGSPGGGGGGGSDPAAAARRSESSGGGADSDDDDRGREPRCRQM